MLRYDFHDSLGYLLCMASSAMQHAINLELTAHGITYRQWQVLAWLVHDGNPLTQGELAARMNIEPPTLVGILDRMEQHNWITREGCPDDRRKKIVRPAPAAEEVWETMVESMRRVREIAASRLSPEQTEELKNMLRNVNETLIEQTGSHAAPCSAQASEAESRIEP